MPCIDFEVEIPIPRLADGQLNWEIVREAWWTIICDYYAERHTTTFSTTYPPLTLAVEMRINGGSDIIMSSQRGNEATCSIEVLSHNIVESKDWNKYIQRLFDKLCKVCEKYNLRRSIRPHWAKQWQGLTWADENGVRMNIADYLKNVTYASAIAEFKDQLSRIGRMYGFTLDDCQRMFSNPVMDYLIFNTPGSRPPPLQTISKDGGVGGGAGTGHGGTGQVYDNSDCTIA
jgi:hypothetical protein